MQLLINAYYMQERKVDLPEHKASIEKFEQCATNMIQMFTDALQTNHDLRESVLQEFSATMDSKDKVIQNLQDQMAELKAAKENAEKTATASAQAAGQALKDWLLLRKAESSSQLAAEKEKNNTLPWLKSYLLQKRRARNTTVLRVKKNCARADTCFRTYH